MIDDYCILRACRVKSLPRVWRRLRRRTCTPRIGGLRARCRHTPWVSSLRGMGAFTIGSINDRTPLQEHATSSETYLSVLSLHDLNGRNMSRIETVSAGYSSLFSTVFKPTPLSRSAVYQPALRTQSRNNEKHRCTQAIPMVRAIRLDEHY